MWYLIHDDTYGLQAIYDITFTEIPYFAQLQPFDLVALDTNLQELRVTDSFTKWWESAPTNQPFPHTMLTHEQRQFMMIS